MVQSNMNVFAIGSRRTDMKNLIIIALAVIVLAGCGRNADRITGDTTMKTVAIGVLVPDTNTMHGWTFETQVEPDKGTPIVSVRVMLPNTSEWIEPLWYQYNAYSDNTILVTISRHLNNGVDIANSQYDIEVRY